MALQLLVLIAFILIAVQVHPSLSQDLWISAHIEDTCRVPEVMVISWAKVMSFVCADPSLQKK